MKGERRKSGTPCWTNMRSYTSSRTFAISAKRKGISQKLGDVVSSISLSCRNSEHGDVNRFHSQHDEREYVPTLSHDGGTMWHFFLSFKLEAIQSGTLHFVGGRSGPYAPYFSSN